MKKVVLIVILLCLLPILAPANAQEQADIETMVVEMWPDYDRNDMLVLLTGSVAATPATVTVPIPESAELNVVARVTANNNMIDDVAVDASVSGEVTFTLTQDTRFRVEYYDVYEVVDGRNTYTFTWTAPETVEAMDTLVQQPSAATLLTVNPAPASVGQSSNDGLTYHQLATQTVPAFQAYSVTISYDNPDGVLTVNNPPAMPDSGAAMPAAPTPAVDQGFPWEITLAVLGGVILLGVVIWQVMDQQQKPKRRATRKPKPARPKASKAVNAKRPSPRPTKAAKFCHECGSPVAAKDKFCRECGTAVK